MASHMLVVSTGQLRLGLKLYSVSAFVSVMLCSKVYLFSGHLCPEDVVILFQCQKSYLSTDIRCIRLFLSILYGY